MFRRTRELGDPVTIYLDGVAVPADRGEPIAASLLAADKTILARSPKLHRPRSPSCMRGGCDGCLMRVSGKPNIMTCLTAVGGDEQIESQNVVGSRKADLLRVTDWFFPKGIDHHHFMAGVPALGSIMQGFARKIAGLGRLPSEIEPEAAARIVEADVAVVGGGLSGLVVASHLEKTGARVVLVDDGIRLGGSIASAPSELGTLVRDYLPQSETTKVFSRSTAVGVYLGDLLVVTPDEALVVRAPAHVFATGAHDGTLPFAGNDMPGVMSARALATLLGYGLIPDGKVVVVGQGFWAELLGKTLGEQAICVPASALVQVEGSSVVKRVVLRDEGKDEEATRTIKSEILALALPGAPAFEVAAQAGADVKFVPERGFVVCTDSEGRAGEGIFAVGECTGIDFDPQTLIANARRTADAISRR